MKIYLVRHGETNYNKRKIIQGSGIDGPLNQKGQLQAMQFFQEYKKTSFDALYTSTLQRTIQTMKPFVSPSLDVNANPDINEIEWGVHEGKKSNSTLVKRYKNLIRSWSDNDFDARIKGGDSFTTLSKRVSRFIQLIKQSNHENVLVCTHGRTLRCMLILLMNEHPREMEKYLIHNTGLYILKIENDECKILIRNSTSHLK